MKGENLDLNALDLLKFARRANQYKKHSDVENYPDLTIFEVAKTLLIIAKCLRYIKLSYGFINSILMIILVKPLHEPLLRFWEKIRNVNKKQ